MDLAPGLLAARVRASSSWRPNARLQHILSHNLCLLGSSPKTLGRLYLTGLYRLCMGESSSSLLQKSVPPAEGRFKFQNEDPRPPSDSSTKESGCTSAKDDSDITIQQMRPCVGTRRGAAESICRAQYALSGRPTLGLLFLIRCISRARESTDPHLLKAKCS